MVNTTEEIMLTMVGRDDASQVFANIDKNAQSMASNISAAMSKVNTGLMSIGQVSDNLMQSLTGKSAMDIIFGTSSKAETNQVLLKNMLEDVEKNYESFYDTVDKTTDTSLVSMQELIPALNALNAATGATDRELQNITPDVANFGAAVLAQTGSVDQAQQAMMDLAKGYKGAFASLDQYGISEDALARAGWKEGEGSIEDYMDAVSEVVGSTEELMQTNQGLDALIGKAFSRAGKKIGNEFLPVIKDLKRGFLDLDNEMGGAITSAILLGSAGVDTANTIFWNITTAANGIRDLKDGFNLLKNAIKGTGKAAEATGDAINAISNMSDIGAGVAGAGSAVGAGAQAAKGAGKGEKVLEGGMDALLMADMLKGNKPEKSVESLEEALKMSTDSKLYDDAIKAWEDEGQTLTGAIKDKFGNFKTRLTDAFSSIRNFDFKGTLLSPFTKMKSGLTSVIGSIKGFSFGETLQNGLEKGFGGIGNIARGISGKFSALGASIKNIDIVGKLKGLDSSLYQSIKGFSFKDTLGSLKDAFSGLKGAEVVAEGVEEVAEIGTAVAAAGPEMEAASVGAEAASVGAASLSGAFTSMIVPALALAAVLLIMIPIFGLVAAEALIVIRLLAELMEALNFDSIDLDGAINGISQVAVALAWVGVAMLALTAVNITTQIALVTSFLTGLFNPLQTACDALMEAAGLLKQFASVGIDASVATNIHNITASLASIATAMAALTWNNIVTGFSNWIAGALGFSSVTDGLIQAKDDIIKASEVINEFSGITPLDDSVAQNIQNVCDSLASIGDAMGALRSIRDAQNWDNTIGGLMEGIFGEGLDIQSALLAVKDDIINASQALAQFTGISEIPEGIADKIKAVSDTLTSVNDAFETLRTLRDNSNWDAWMEGIFGGMDIASALEQIKNDLMTASQKLAELSGLSEISEDTTTKIGLIGDALTKVSEVCTTISQLPSMEGFDSATITTAISNVQTVATELAKLNNIVFDGAAADTILGSLQTTLENVKTTLAAATGFTEPSVNIGSSIVSGVQSGLSPLPSTVQTNVSSAISSANSTANSGGQKLGTETTNGLKSTLKLADAMKTEMEYVKTAVDNGIAAAKSAAESGAQEVVAAFKSGINSGSPGDVARAMGGEMEYTKEAIRNSYGFLRNAAYLAGKYIVDSFGKPSLDLEYFTNGNQLTAEHLSALQTTISRAPDKTDNRPVTIIVQEGAIGIDARNHTVKEAQSLLITALEGMDHITNVDVDV